MCNPWTMDFATKCVVKIQELGGKLERVLDVGSYDVNGTTRVAFAGLNCEYIGMDLMPGPGVDLIDNIETTIMPGQSFDVLTCTNTLEHVHDWKKAVTQMVRLTKVDGFLIIVAPSPGFEYHMFPEDNWRFWVEDLKRIFTHPVPTLMEGLDTDMRRGHYAGSGVLARRCTPDLSLWLNNLAQVNVMNIHKDLHQDRSMVPDGR